MNTNYESPKIELVEVAVDIVTSSIPGEQTPPGDLEW